MCVVSTYDHRLRKTWYPVRSALIKPQIDRLVVGWVTTSESRLLYVLFFRFLPWALLFSSVQCHGFSWDFTLRVGSGKSKSGQRDFLYQKNRARVKAWPRSWYKYTRSKYKHLDALIFWPSSSIIWRFTLKHHVLSKATSADAATKGSG